MNLKNFIENKEVDYTKNLIDVEELRNIEKIIGVEFGGQLTKYVLKYGYLAYKHIEFYGVNSKQVLDSDMVTQTVYLHKYFSKTSEYIALENSGDGVYVIVSSEDKIYEYSSDDDSVKEIGLKLFDYILQRFQEIETL